MDEVSVSLKIKDLLNTYLIDPRSTVGGEARSSWAHTDEPLTQATYPRIFIEKMDSTNDIIGIGTDYPERTFCYFRIWFYSQKDFKITETINNVSTTIKDENLVSFYLDQIKTTLKTYQTTTQALGIDGFKKLGNSKLFFDSETKIHRGYIVIRYWFFTVPS